LSKKLYTEDCYFTILITEAAQKRSLFPGLQPRAAPASPRWEQVHPRLVVLDRRSGSLLHPDGATGQTLVTYTVRHSHKGISHRNSDKIFSVLRHIPPIFNHIPTLKGEGERE